MNWRRGVVLAAIHLTVAAVVILRAEADYWPNIRSERVRVPVVIPPSATAEEAAFANFFPCDEGGIIDRAFAPREMIASAANMPAALLVGCPALCFGQSCREAIRQNAKGGGSDTSHPMRCIWSVVVCCGWISAGAASAVVVGTRRFYHRVHDSSCFGIAAHP